MVEEPRDVPVDQVNGLADACEVSLRGLVTVSLRDSPLTLEIGSDLRYHM